MHAEQPARFASTRSARTSWWSRAFEITRSRIASRSSARRARARASRACAAPPASRARAPRRGGPASAPKNRPSRNASWRSDDSASIGRAVRPSSSSTAARWRAWCSRTSTETKRSPNAPTARSSGRTATSAIAAPLVRIEALADQREVGRERVRARVAAELARERERVGLGDRALQAERHRVELQPVDLARAPAVRALAELLVGLQLVLGDLRERARHRHLGGRGDQPVDQLGIAAR